MNQLVEWLPFPIDDAANQRSRKWESFDGGNYHYSLEGELLDPLIFVPKTSKNEQYSNTLSDLGSLDNLERWFAQRIATGNRNNQMIKYALALSDSGLSFNEVEKSVIAFNNRLDNGLTEQELHSTILQTVAKKMVA